MNNVLAGLQAGAGYTNTFYVKDVPAFVQAIEGLGHYVHVFETGDDVQVHINPELYQDKSAVPNYLAFGELPIRTTDAVITTIKEHALYGQVIKLRQVLFYHDYTEKRLSADFNFNMIVIEGDGSVESMDLEQYVSGEHDNETVFEEAHRPELGKQIYLHTYSDIEGSRVKAATVEVPVDVEVVVPRPEGQSFNQNRASSNWFYVKDFTNFYELMKQWRVTVHQNTEEHSVALNSVMMVVDSDTWPTEQLELLHRHLQENLEPDQLVVLLDSPRHPADQQRRALFTYTGEPAFVERHDTTENLSDFGLEMMLKCGGGE